MRDVRLQVRDHIRRLAAFRRSPLGIKLYRYVMGSVITTIVSFSVLTLVYGVFRWWTAVPSTVVANVVATVPAYWLNRTWTWGKVGRSDPWREVIPFWVLSVLGIVISMGTAALAEDVARSHHLGHLAAIVVVDGANLLAYGGVFIAKYVLFERLFRVAERTRVARTGGAAAPVAGRLPAPGADPVAVATSLLARRQRFDDGLALDDEDEPPALVAASGGAG